MPGDRPNVVYILTDDQRAELLGCAGHPVLETPNLDALAADGVRYSNAFCTSPLCTPSRVCHYLGQWERRHGVNFNSETALSVDAWRESFPMRLADAGYVTGWVGKNHVPVGEGGYASGVIEDSFHYWYGTHQHPRFYPKEQALSTPDRYENAEADTQAEILSEGVRAFLEPDRPASRRFRAECDRELPARPDDRPFCLCLTFNLPHNAATGSMQLRPSDSERYRGRYRDRFDEVPLPEAYEHYWSDAAPKLPDAVYSREWLPSYDYVRSPPALRERLLRNYQTVSAVDRAIGQIRASLERIGEADDTIIVFSTDHGIMHGEHGLGGKAFLYEPAVRIPLIVHDPRAPGSARGQVRDELVAVPDLAPTVLDLADVPVPDAMQGRSLRDGIYDRRVDDWRAALLLEQLFDNQHYPMSEAIRTRDWKYVRYFERTPAPGNGPPWGTTEDYAERRGGTTTEEPVHEELFDLAADPNETDNLAKRSAHRERRASLRATLDGRIKERFVAEPATAPIS